MEPKDLKGGKPSSDIVRQMELPPEFGDALDAKMRSFFNKMWEEKKKSLMEEFEKMKSTLAESALEDLMADAPKVKGDTYQLPGMVQNLKVEASKSSIAPPPQPLKPAGHTQELIIAYLKDLQQAKIEKNQNRARFCRARLRELGWNVSTHGYKPPSNPVPPMKTLTNITGIKPPVEAPIQKVSGAELKSIISQGPPKPKAQVPPLVKKLSEDIIKTLGEEVKEDE